MKRIAAWVGLAYMALLLGAQAYFLYGGGELLYGWWGLLVCPAMAGICAASIYQKKNEIWKPALAYPVAVLSAICFIVFLIVGIRGAMENFV